MTEIEDITCYEPQLRAFDEIRDYVEVVSTYNCKMCIFSSGSMLTIHDHIMRTHLNTPAPVVFCDNAVSAASEINDGNENVLIVLPVPPNKSTDMNRLEKVTVVASRQVEELPVDVKRRWKLNNVTSCDSNSQTSKKVNKFVLYSANKRYLHQLTIKEPALPALADVGSTGIITASSNEELKEAGVNDIFICSLCGTSFSSAGIIEHMIDIHGVQVEPASATEANQNSSAECTSILTIPTSENSNPPNVTSTATQVQLVKKPGRKRKVVCESSVSKLVSAKASSNASEAVEHKVTNAETSRQAVRALGIEHSDGNEVSSRPLKRQIRPPNKLVKDYHIIHQRHWKRHISSSDAVPENRCKVIGCCSTFSTNEGLAYHARCHILDNDSTIKFSCPECRAPFQNWVKLRVHLQVIHNIVADGFHCNLCDFQAETELLLSEHNLAVHSMDLSSDSKCKVRMGGSRQASAGKDIQDNKCTLCERTFANRKCCLKHIEIVHEKRKMFMCSVCGYNSARKATLQVHMRIHTGEKPFRCDLCLFSASDHNTLRRHRMRHTGQKLYGCALCSYTCIQASSLKEHMRTKHPGQQPVVVSPPSHGSSPTATAVYACNFCSYETVNKRNYLCHVINHDVGRTKTSCVQDTAIENKPVASAGQADDKPQSLAGLPVTSTDATVNYPIFSVLSSNVDKASDSNVFTVISYQDIVGTSSSQLFSVLSSTESNQLINSSAETLANHSNS